jgi:hypothetical protein
MNNLLSEQAQIESTGILLSSPAPFKNEIYNLRFLYLVLGVLGAIFGFIVGSIGMALLCCLFLLFLSFLIINLISGLKVGKIRRIKFELPNNVDSVTLSGLLVSPLMALNMTVERNNNITIKYKGCVFTIFLSDGFFTIWPKESLVKRMLIRRTARLYKLSIITVPIVAYNIQVACKAQK